MEQNPEEEEEEEEEGGGGERERGQTAWEGDAA